MSENKSVQLHNMNKVFLTTFFILCPLIPALQSPKNDLR